MRNSSGVIGEILLERESGLPSLRHTESWTISPCCAARPLRLLVAAPAAGRAVLLGRRTRRVITAQHNGWIDAQTGGVRASAPREKTGPHRKATLHGASRHRRPPINIAGDLRTAVAYSCTGSAAPWSCVARGGPMRRKRLARLLRKLRTMRKSLPQRDRLLLRIGAARKEAGRAFGSLARRSPLRWTRPC